MEVIRSLGKDNQNDGSAFTAQSFKRKGTIFILPFYSLPKYHCLGKSMGSYSFTKRSQMESASAGSGVMIQVVF